MQEGFSRKLDDAWSGFGAIGDRAPSIGIILGSGLGDFAHGVAGVEVPFASLPGFPRPTVQGHSGLFKVGRSVVVMAGRIHFYEGHPIDDVVLPVFVLHRLGVKTLIVTNAAGGVNRSYSPGDLVLIRDHINLMGVNPLRGPNPAQGPRFPDMSTAYDAALRRMAREASKTPLMEGVYAAFSGPSYETPAEIGMLGSIGADLVGMSTVPEDIVAVHMGLNVLGFSILTDECFPDALVPITLKEVIKVANKAEPKMTAIMKEVVRRMKI